MHWMGCDPIMDPSQPIQMVWEILGVSSLSAAYVSQHIKMNNDKGRFCIIKEDVGDFIVLGLI